MHHFSLFLHGHMAFSLDVCLFFFALAIQTPVVGLGSTCCIWKDLVSHSEVLGTHEFGEILSIKFGKRKNFRHPNFLAQWLHLIVNSDVCSHHRVSELVGSKVPAIKSSVWPLLRLRHHHKNRWKEGEWGECRAGQRKDVEAWEGRRPPGGLQPGELDGQTARAVEAAPAGASPSGWP